jgi:hypothetical protein
MDAETISTLKTVCTAGGASSGFNGNSNAQLEQLVEDGFLVVVNVVKAKGPKSSQKSRAYQPTDKGRELCRKLAVKGVA